jgi:3,4-dihydroxy 2-butanone 4-phosphate synthase/GTP cyclohydrolase II
MSRAQRHPHETAFTTSIEARDGVTTGISAADRARTISVAIDAGKGPEHIVTPGHVFPLVARDGGVLVRAGHTEAAVDVSRLAGLNPSGVICEIMREDGTMARIDDLVAFAQLHGLKIGTIRDLIAYRLKKDHLVEQTAEARSTAAGAATWTAKSFLNKALGTEQLALVKGRSIPTSRCWCACTAHLFADVFGERSARAGCSPARCGDRGGRLGRDRRAQRRRPGIAVARADRRSGKAGRRTWRRCAIMASARRSSPRSASTT